MESHGSAAEAEDNVPNLHKREFLQIALAPVALSAREVFAGQRTKKRMEMERVKLARLSQLSGQAVDAEHGTEALTEILKMMGSPFYRIRKQATDKLAKLGPAFILKNRKQLTTHEAFQLTNDLIVNNIEIRYRYRKVYPLLVTAEYELRLDGSVYTPREGDDLGTPQQIEHFLENKEFLWQL